MKFLLQTEKGEITDVEVFNMLQLLKHRSFCHEYKIDDIEGIKSNNYSEYYPIGTIPFVQTWLNEYKGIDKMDPIEVPEVLRTEKYLGRKYQVYTLKELPLDGYGFLKDIEKLKSFSYCGDLLRLDKTDKDIFKSNTYLVSSFVDIKAEYRVFVLDYSIEAIQYYDGDCTIFPDVSVLKEMIGRYYLEKNRPRSYTMDIAVLSNGRTVILEVHPVVSVGTYGYTEESLLYMYRDGIDYYISKGKEV